MRRVSNECKVRTVSQSNACSSIKAKHRHVNSMSYFECFSVTLMLQCNLSKSDESTFFVLNVDWVFVQN